MFNVASSFTIFLSADPDGNDLEAMNLTSPATYCLKLDVLAKVIFIDEDGCRVFVSEDNQNYFQKE